MLETAERTPLAIVAFNAGSGIAARELSRDPDARIGRDWIAERLAAALSLRERLFDAPFYRLCHAEADGLPGLIVDRMGDALAVQPNTAWAERSLPDILAALDALLQPDTIVVNRDSRGRGQEGLEGGREVAKGLADAPVRVVQNGAIYLADLMDGQKTGLYFDQRDNHAFAARLAGGARVLDVFAHSGGFSLACLANGGASAIAIDSSERALALADEAAALNGFAGFKTRRADAIDAMKGLAAEGAAFDLVVCDPPAFAPSKQALAAGLRAYERVARFAAPLVAPGGFLTLCSCSHAVSPEALREVSVRGFRNAGRTGRLIHSGRAGADHPIHAALPESGYLKAMFFALD